MKRRAASAAPVPGAGRRAGGPPRGAAGIASKLIDDQIIVIDELSFEVPATAEMASILKSLDCHGQTVLVTTDQLDNNVYKSARNIADVSVAPVSDLNALSVLRPKKMLVTRAALDKIKERSGAQAED